MAKDDVEISRFFEYAGFDHFGVGFTVRSGGKKATFTRSANPFGDSFGRTVGRNTDVFINGRKARYTTRQQKPRRNTRKNMRQKRRR